MATDNPFLIEAQGIRKVFGKGSQKILAVDDVSVRIPRGKTLGVLGESGSGKSTLGRCLLRLIEPDAGTLHFKGEKVSSLSASQFRPLRRNLQMIFQNPFSSLNPKMSIGDAIEDPLRIWNIGDRDHRRKRVKELLDQVGIHPRFASAYPHEFSGGQQQRVNIARALAVDPQFIVCDEAVSALDVSIQAQIINLLMDLQKQLGLTYLFISHNLGVVEYLSDEVLILHQGRQVECGPTETIFKNPHDEYTRNLIASVPFIPTAQQLLTKVQSGNR